MIVKEYNEFMQLGFPKGAWLEANEEWDEVYDKYTCELTSKLLLADDKEVAADLLEHIWLDYDDGTSVSLSNAVDAYFNLKVNPKFKIGDKVIYVSERGFLPNYWTTYRKFTAYKSNLTVTEIDDHTIYLSYKDKQYKTLSFSHTGYAITGVSTKKGRPKFLGLKLDYEEYIVHSTPELEAARLQNMEDWIVAKRLLCLSNELINSSYHPDNSKVINRVLGELEGLITESSRETIDTIIACDRKKYD